MIEIHIISALLIISILCGYLGASSEKGSSQDNACKIVFTACYWGAVIISTVTSLFKVFN